MNAKLCSFFVLTLGIAFSAAAGDTLPSHKPSVEHGRYITKISGCNDCHTPLYMPTNGAVPEKDWMIGVPVGWMGPWGTTYAANVRQKVFSMSEDAWVDYLKNFKTRPPMPYGTANAFNEVDSRSMYRFLKSLGNNSQSIPVALGPGEKPKTPYFDFNLVMPAGAGAAKKN
jgi:hypothetical protein